MLKKIIPLLCVSGLLLAETKLIEEQSIKVYDMPFSKTDNLSVDYLEKHLSSSQPQYILKQGVSKNNSIYKSSNEDIIIIVNKNRNPILNYNDFINLVRKYAKENMPTADLNRLDKALSIASIQTSVTDELSIDNRLDKIDVITSLKEDLNSNKKTDLTKLSDSEIIDFAINNYNSLNTDPTPDEKDDTRFKVVTVLKEKLSKYKNIDPNLIDYGITLRELRLLKSSIQVSSR